MTNRLRRVAAFPLVRLVSIVALFAALATPAVLMMQGRAGHWRSLVVTWIMVAVLAAVTIAVERICARKSIAAIGLAPEHAPRDLALGLLFGGLLFSLVIGELALGGYYRIVAVHPAWSLAPVALLLAGGAIVEELLFRGVIFRLVQEWGGTWIALVVSAAFFGLAHAANPGATWFSSLAIALEAGVLLGAAFVVTRNLWFPIGLHFAWNFCEGPVYGTQVSGNVLNATALTASLSGPAMVTGGSFGPEAGLAAVGTCSLAAIVLLFAARRHRLIVPPAWLKTVTSTGEISSV